jgi:hypothetical protein
MWASISHISKPHPLWFRRYRSVGDFQNCLAFMAFSSAGSFSCQHLQRHGISVYTVSSEGPASMFHSGIRTGESRITRSLRLRSNHCATWAASQGMSVKHQKHVLWLKKIKVFISSLKAKVSWFKGFIQKSSCHAVSISKTLHPYPSWFRYVAQIKYFYKPEYGVKITWSKVFIPQKVLVKTHLQYMSHISHPYPPWFKIYSPGNFFVGQGKGF